MFTEYNILKTSEIKTPNDTISSFLLSNDKNIDEITVNSFGEEWDKFHSFSNEEIENIGNEYFDIVDDSIINKETIVLDVGCGSGRWDYYLADKVKFIEAIDPSNAVVTASQILQEKDNIRVTQASVSNIPFDDESFDFVMSLGVLHHIPDTQQAVNDAVKKLKKGGHFLVYLYYNLDNRGFFYKLLFRFSNLFRFLISKLPTLMKKIVCDIIAVIIYLPFVGLSTLVKKIFYNSNVYKKIPLSYYVGKSLNVIRNDALDRFGTPLEQRFSKKQIKNMLENAGLTKIKFSDNKPFWHAVGKKI